METLILYGQLFWQFFKTGLFAVGGGLATLPFLQEMSRLTHWFTTTDIADMTKFVSRDQLLVYVTAVFRFFGAA